MSGPKIGESCAEYEERRRADKKPSAELIAMVDEFGQCCIGYGEWNGYGSSKCIDEMAAARRKLLARLFEIESSSDSERSR